VRAAKKGLESHPERLTYFIIMSFIKPGQAKGMYAGEYLSRIKLKKFLFIKKEPIDYD
jgi:hypothetical protein